MNPHFEQVRKLFKDGYTPIEITTQLPLSLDTVASICGVMKSKGRWWYR